MEISTTLLKTMKYIAPVVEAIEQASAKSVWDGIDGVKQYLAHPRLIMLKENDVESYYLAMAQCFKAVIDGANRSGEDSLIRKFIKDNEEHMEYIQGIAPELFISLPTYLSLKIKSHKQ